MLIGTLLFVVVVLTIVLANGHELGLSADAAVITMLTAGGLFTTAIIMAQGA